MNPPAAASPTQTAVRPEADGSVLVALATDPTRPPIPFEATIRHPDRFRAALRAFLGVMVADVSLPSTRIGPTFGNVANFRLRDGYAQARRACARSLVESDTDLWRIRLPVDPLVTVGADAWIVEGFSGDQSAYVRTSVSFDELIPISNVRFGTISVVMPPTFFGSLDQIRSSVSARLRMAASVSPLPPLDKTWPPGWLRGFSGVQSAMSLPTRRVPIDRGGLFGLISALGRSTKVRAGRSIEIRWEQGRAIEALVRPESPSVPLHARPVTDGSSGSVRVVVGRGLVELSGLFPWVDSADLFLLGSGLPSFWSVRMGGIRVLLGLPSWTPDGRLGSLCLDSVAPPVEAGRFLTNQVAATFRDHPTQTRREVVDRTRGSEPEVTAILSRFAGLGRVLPEPDTGLFRWRPAFDESVSSSLINAPEPAETTAARAITRTSSVQVTRDEVRPDGQGRRIEGLILDRPVTVTLNGDGWITRGRCTCSHWAGGSIDQRGPCRHLIALQAQAQAQAQAQSGSAKDFPDLATWFAAFSAPIKPV